AGLELALPRFPLRRLRSLAIHRQLSAEASRNFSARVGHDGAVIIRLATLMSVDERLRTVDNFLITAIALTPRYREAHGHQRHQLDPRHPVGLSNPRATRRPRHFPKKSTPRPDPPGTRWQSFGHR